jgi:hypothetical protein
VIRVSEDLRKGKSCRIEIALFEPGEKKSDGPQIKLDFEEGPIELRVIEAATRLIELEPQLGQDYSQPEPHRKDQLLAMKALREAVLEMRGKDDDV